MLCCTGGGIFFFAAPCQETICMAYSQTVFFFFVFFLRAFWIYWEASSPPQRIKMFLCVQNEKLTPSLALYKNSPSSIIPEEQICDASLGTVLCSYYFWILNLHYFLDTKLIFLLCLLPICWICGKMYGIRERQADWQCFNWVSQWHCVSLDLVK